jgi:serine/threonine-protein kinase
MGFISDAAGSLYKLPTGGGAFTKLLDWESFGGGAWGPDNRIYYVPSLPGGIVSVDADGKNPKEILKPDPESGERIVKHPYVLPSGKTLLYTAATKDAETFNETRIMGFNLKTGQKKVLVEGGMYARYSPSGHLLYAKNGSVFAALLDEDRLSLRSSPVSVLDGVLMSTSTGQAYYNLSANGDLVYAAGPTEGGKRSLVWVGRSGREEALDLPQRSFLHPRISPDGRRLAVEVEGANHDWYIYDFDRGVLTKMSTDGVSHWPSWSPDGKTISFRSGIMQRFAMYSMPSDRSGAASPLNKNKPADVFQNPVSWSPDGKYLTFEQGGPSRSVEIYAQPVGSEAKPIPISSGKFMNGSPKFSPDGAWVVFCTNESKRAEVYVQPFPGPGPKIQISSEGGTDPIWSRDGRELFYRNGDKMMVVDVAVKPEFRAGKPRDLWSGHYSHGMSSSCGPPGLSSSNYDVSPDGKRFLMIKDAMQDAVSRQVVVVMGWSRELERTLAASRP